MIWLVLVVGIPALIGLFYLFRSFRRWPETPSKDPTVQQARARLWSTKNLGDQ